VGYLAGPLRGIRPRISKVCVPGPPHHRIDSCHRSLRATFPLSATGTEEKGDSVSFGLTTICRRLWIALGIALAALALLAFHAPSRAAAAEIPDASCAGPPESFQTNTGVSRVAQSFTAQNTGPLTSAQLEVDKTGTAGDWIVDILDTNMGVPVDGVLATATVPDATVPAGGSLINANFAAPASVIAGHLYALEFSRPASSQTGEGERDGDDCPGQLFGAAAAPGTFSAAGHTGADLVFSVTVNVPTTPPGVTPGLLTTGERAAALKKCKKKHTKAKRRKCRRRANQLPV
jgi:hypothetical protein